jgi:hypothetical protein
LSKKCATVALVVPPSAVKLVDPRDSVGPGILTTALAALVAPCQLWKNGVSVYVHVVALVPLSGRPGSTQLVPATLPAHVGFTVVERLPGETLLRATV